MRPPRRWLLGLLACHSRAALARAKMVMGIASGEDYQLVSTFCFTFPYAPPGETGSNGHIHSQTIVSSNGHKFLVVNRTELEQGFSCDDLARRAKVIEPLSERTKEVVAYDLTLNVEPSMHRQHVAAVIARCGQTVDAEYIVEFTNPGSYMDQHFACSEQGLLQSYLWFSALVAGLAPLFGSALRVLHRRQAHNDVSALFFTGAAFFGARVWLFALHLAIYSRNGMGLGMLLFLAQFLDFLSSALLSLVLVSLVHGVYVTRPCVPPGGTERRAILQVTVILLSTHLFSTLVCGFKVDGPLSPFGVTRGVASTPYHLARVGAGLFCLSSGLKLAKEDEAQAKKQHLLRFSFLAFGWFLAIPVVMLSTGEDSWHHDAVVIDVATFALFGTLLHDFWPSRFGTIFNCIKPTERMHPYSEFGLPD